jgi:hypothetical protein
MQLPDAQTLLAVGVSLVMAGVVMRGFASNARRDLARRKEHRIDDRRERTAGLNDEFERPPGWFERNLGHIANFILVTGVVLAVTGFVRF